MNKILIIAVFSVITVNYSIAQKIEKDTLKIEENVSKIIKSHWAIQIGVGVSKFYYDKNTKEYFGNHWSGSFSFTIFFKNIFVRGDFKPMTVNVKNPLYFNGEELNELADLNIVKTDVMLGYSFNILSKVSIEPYLGYLNTSFPVINEDELRTSYDINSAKGFTVGFNINKYIHLKEFQYLILFLNNNFNLSNYSNTNSDLGNSFYAFSVGVAFKGFISKKTY